MKNPYYNPEDHDLTILGEVEVAGVYSFDKIVVWRRNSDGSLFWQTDSGCSCPSPFEDIAGVADMRPISSARDLALFTQELSYYHKSDPEGVQRVARKVKGELL